MVVLAQARPPPGAAIVGNALELPFADGAFDRVLTGHYYGHLPPRGGPGDRVTDPHQITSTS